MSFLERLRERAASSPMRVALPEGDDPRVQAAAETLAADGLAPSDPDRWSRRDRPGQRPSAEPGGRTPADAKTRRGPRRRPRARPGFRSPAVRGQPGRPGRSGRLRGRRLPPDRRGHPGRPVEHRHSAGGRPGQFLVLHGHARRQGADLRGLRSRAGAHRRAVGSDSLGHRPRPAVGGGRHAAGGVPVLQHQG